MTERRGTVLLAAVGVATLIAATLWVAVGGSGRGGSSSLSAGPAGWAGVRGYLEATGRRVVLEGRPPDASRDRPGVLVMAFPAEVPLWPAQAEQLRLAVRQGQRLIVGYSERAPSAAELMVLSAFDLDLTAASPEPPADLAGWLAVRRRIDRLTGPAGWPDLEIGYLETAPKAPPDADVWYRGADGTPVVFTIERGQGEVVLLPAPLWSNGRLRSAGNADLLERIAAREGPVWVFDEWSHGLVEKGAAVPPGEAYAFDLLILHLGLLTALGLVTLGRRFGTPWRRTHDREASVAEFLRDLGALHERLGHFSDGARALLARSRELDSRLDGLPRDPEIRTGGELLALARVVARRQAAPGGGDPRHKERTDHG